MPVMIIDGVPYGVIQSAINKRSNNRMARIKIEEAQIVGDSNVGSQTNILHITDEVYAELAQMIVDHASVSYKESISKKFEYETDDMMYNLDISAIVYWRLETAPDGEWREISDIAPIWVEMHTTDPETGDEIPNDMKFGRLKDFII